MMRGGEWWRGHCMNSQHTLTGYLMQWGWILADCPLASYKDDLHSPPPLSPVPVSSKSESSDSIQERTLEFLLSFGLSIGSLASVKFFIWDARSATKNHSMANPQLTSRGTATCKIIGRWTLSTLKCDWANS